MKVSIIVTVYNLQDYLETCVISLLNQSLKEIEIILVDDGSTDGSGKICDEYAKSDSRIKVVHKPNGGLVSARKVGLRAATSENIAYVDGDDWIEPNAIEMMYKRMVSGNADIVKCGHYENTEASQKYVKNGIEQGDYDKDDLMKKVYPNMIAGELFYEWKVFPSLCDMLIRKELLEKEQYFVDDEITIGEDAACTFPCMLLAERVSFVDEAYYHYRQTCNSMIKSMPPKDIIREKYKILNDYVLNRVLGLKNVYDVSSQWTDHIIFSMIPRAGLLYDGIEELDYIFPFKNIKKGSRVALYCAGTYGQLLYRNICENNSCEIVVWVDRNYIELSRQGLPVVSPEELLRCKIEGIIVASMFATDREAILRYLDSLQLNVDIGVVEPEFMRSDEVKRGFRLI